MHNLSRFVKKYHFILLFLLIEGISIVLLVKNNHYQRNKITSFSHNYIGSLHSFFNNISNYLNLKHNNEFLSKENAKLLSMLKKQNNLKKDSIHFDQSLFKYKSAQVVNNSVHKSNNYLTLNKGIQHGIKEEMGVITHNGVVGIIYSVSNKFSLVISVLHQESSISVRLKNEMYLGRMLWNGFHYREITIEDIPNHAYVSIGDTIITSGNSTIFPSGIPVGKIKSFEETSGENFYKIKIQLFSDLNRIQYVYVAESRIKREKELLELNKKNDKTDQ